MNSKTITIFKGGVKERGNMGGKNPKGPGVVS